MLICAFSRIILLLIGFTTPATYSMRTNDILNLASDLFMSTVTDKHVCSTFCAYSMLKSIYKLFVCFYSKYIISMGVNAIEELCLSIPAIKSWCIRLDGISGSSFLLVVNIDSGKWRVEVPDEMRTHGHIYIFCHFSIGCYTNAG